MYILGIGLISGSLNGLQTNPVNGIILWSTAIGLFLIGHRQFKSYDTNCNFQIYNFKIYKLIIESLR